MFTLPANLKTDGFGFFREDLGVMKVRLAALPDTEAVELRCPSCCNVLNAASGRWQQFRKRVVSKGNIRKPVQMKHFGGLLWRPRHFAGLKKRQTPCMLTLRSLRIGHSGSELRHPETLLPGGPRWTFQRQSSPNHGSKFFSGKSYLILFGFTEFITVTSQTCRFWGGLLQGLRGYAFVLEIASLARTPLRLFLGTWTVPRSSWFLARGLDWISNLWRTHMRKPISLDVV